MSGAGGLRAEGKSAKNIAGYNAQLSKQEAAMARAKARFDQIQQARKAERIKGAITARVAKAGGAASPVAADIAAEQAMELELENRLIGYEGEVSAKRAESQATIHTLQGLFAQQKAKNAARRANVQFGLGLASLGLSGYSAFSS